MLQETPDVFPDEDNPLNEPAIIKVYSKLEI